MPKIFCLVYLSHLSLSLIWGYIPFHNVPFHKIWTLAWVGNHSEMQSNWTWTFTFLTSQWSSNAREGFDMLELNLLNCCRVTFLPISTAARGKLNFSHNCTFSVHSLGFWHVSASYWSFKTRLNRPSSLWRLLINSGWTKIVTHARSVVLIRKNAHTPHRNWLYVFAKFLALKEVNEILTATNIDLMLKQLLVGPFSCVIMGFF